MKIDIIGDIHGCFKELQELTTLLGYQWQASVPIHPEGRKLGLWAI